MPQVIIMIIRCVVCGKQALEEKVPSSDEYCTTLIGSKHATQSNECYCGHCAAELDENALFPEELAQIPWRNV
jgi:hypothetical protein